MQKPALRAGFVLGIGPSGRSLSSSGYPGSPGTLRRPTIPNLFYQISFLGLDCNNTVSKPDHHLGRAGLEAGPGQPAGGASPVRHFTIFGQKPAVPAGFVLGTGAKAPVPLEFSQTVRLRLGLILPD